MDLTQKRSINLGAVPVECCVPISVQTRKHDTVGEHHRTQVQCFVQYRQTTNPMRGVTSAYWERHTLVGLWKELPMYWITGCILRLYCMLILTCCSPSAQTSTHDHFLIPFRLLSFAHFYFYSAGEYGKYGYNFNAGTLGLSVGEYEIEVYCKDEKHLVYQKDNGSFGGSGQIIVSNPHVGPIDSVNGLYPQVGSSTTIDVGSNTECCVKVKVNVYKQGVTDMRYGNSMYMRCAAKMRLLGSAWVDYAMEFDKDDLDVGGASGAWDVLVLHCCVCFRARAQNTHASLLLLFILSRLCSTPTFTRASLTCAAWQAAHTSCLRTAATLIRRRTCARLMAWLL
jgi:hypothetical protein